MNRCFEHDQKRQRSCLYTEGLIWDIAVICSIPDNICMWAIAFKRRTAPHSQAHTLILMHVARRESSIVNHKADEHHPLALAGRLACGQNPDWHEWHRPEAHRWRHASHLTRHPTGHLHHGVSSAKLACHLREAPCLGGAITQN